jgi:hypothetical protein
MNFVLRKYDTEWTIGSNEHGKPPCIVIRFNISGPRIITRNYAGMHYSPKEVNQALAIANQQIELIAITKRLMS